MNYIEESKKRLKERIVNSPNIFLDNDGFLFDNTEKMNDAAIFTLREIFHIDPLTFKRTVALKNLEKFYSENPSVYARVPWVASESLKLLRQEIENEGEDSYISEFDIFRMSSRAYGGAFLYDSDLSIENVNQHLQDFYTKNPEYYDYNTKYADEILGKIQDEIKLFSSTKTSLFNETSVANGITSRLVFEVYLGIFFGKFDMEILPIPGAVDLVNKLSEYARKSHKRFGVISNRSSDSLLALLRRFDFIGEDKIPEEYITGADPILGGKPKLHTFRKFIPEAEKVVYFGDLPTDVEVCEVLNTTDGDGTAFCVVIPSKYEFTLQNNDGSHNFTEYQNTFCVCLSYPDIISVLHELM